MSRVLRIGRNYGEKFASMDLPEGETCKTCGYFGFCRQLIGDTIADNTTCDWYPIRFAYPKPLARTEGQSANREAEKSAKP